MEPTCCSQCSRPLSLSDTLRARCSGCGQAVAMVEADAAPARAPAPGARPPPASEEALSAADTRVVTAAEVERLRAMLVAAEPGAAAALPRPTPAPVDASEVALRAADRAWFVLVRGQQLGPLDGRALRRLADAGGLHGGTFVWRAGLEGWRRAGELPELAAVAGAAAAPPPAEAARVREDQVAPSWRAPSAPATERPSAPAAPPPVPRRTGRWVAAAAVALGVASLGVGLGVRSDPPPDDELPGELPHLAATPRPAPPAAGAPEAAPPEALARALVAARPTLQECIAREHVGAGGEVRVRMTVDASGAVRDAEVDRADLELTDLGRCLRTRARRLRFEHLQGRAVDLELALALGGAP